MSSLLLLLLPSLLPWPKTEDVELPAVLQISAGELRESQYKLAGSQNFKAVAHTKVHLAVQFKESVYLI